MEIFGVNIEPPETPQPSSMVECAKEEENNTAAKSSVGPQDEACGESSNDEDYADLNLNLNPLSSSSTSRRCEKKFEELTEEDIMQLTREDCRRYLKEKGMRRPSWNKSQAVQQLLFLKGLLESKGDDKKIRRKKIARESQVDKKDSQQLPVSIYNDQCASSIDNRDVFSDLLITEKHCSSQAVQNVSSVATDIPLTTEQHKNTFLPSQRTSCGRQKAPQLTIFYSGMVKVFDNVSEDKVQAIMLIAGSGKTTPGFPVSAVHSQCHPPVPFSLSDVVSSSSVSTSIPKTTC